MHLFFTKSKENVSAVIAVKDCSGLTVKKFIYSFLLDILKIKFLSNLRKFTRMKRVCEGINFGLVNFGRKRTFC